MTALAMPPRDIIQSLWIGARLSMMEQLCIHSFLAHGHPFHLYVDGAVQGIPAGTVVRDVREILPDAPILRYRSGMGAGSPSLYSDLFRFALLCQRGGWWIDLDVVALCPFPSPKEPVVGLVRRSRRRTGPVPGVMWFPPEHPVMARCLAACAPDQLEHSRWGDFGPALLARAVEELSLEEACLHPPDLFYPVDAPRFWDLMRPGPLPSGSLAVHLWHNLWRHYGVDPDRRFPAASPYEQLLTRYHPDAAAARRPVNVPLLLLRSIPKRLALGLALAITSRRARWRP